MDVGEEFESSFCSVRMAVSVLAWACLFAFRDESNTKKTYLRQKKPVGQTLGHDVLNGMGRHGTERMGHFKLTPSILDANIVLHYLASN